MNIEELTNKAEELGYVIDYREGEIKYITPRDRGSYTPEIYGGRKMFGEYRPFEIQTTAYGTLSSEEIDKVIAGYRAAQKMVKVLNEFVEA